MGSVILTDPQNGQITDAAMISANNASLKVAINGGLDNTNISAVAAIGASKIAGYPNDGTKALLGDGTWGTLAVPSPPGKTSLLGYSEVVTDYLIQFGMNDTDAVTVVGLPTISVDGLTPVMLTFKFSAFSVLADRTESFLVWTDGATILGTESMFHPGGGVTWPGHTYMYRYVPTAGNHTWAVKARNQFGDPTIKADTGGSGNKYTPMFLEARYAG